MQTINDINLTDVNIGIFLKIEDCEGGSSCIRVNTVCWAIQQTEFPIISLILSEEHET
jgi:hypothetical protein